MGGFFDLTPPFDKLYHAGNFGVLGILLYLATGRVYLAVLLASLYGVSDEVHQAYVPGRSADMLDWVADTVGAGVGVGVAVWAVRLWLRRRNPSR